MTAKQIVSLRRRLGMSQREFARFVGVSGEYMSRLENGHREPGAVLVNLLKRMAGEARDGQRKQQQQHA